MKKISIFTFLNLIFSVTILLFFILLFIYIKVDKQRYQAAQKERYALMVDNLKKLKPEEIKKLFFDKLNFKEISSDSQKSDIVREAKKIYHDTTVDTTIDVLNFNDKTYIYIKNYNFKVVFRDNPSMQYDISNILIAALVILLLLGFMYILLIQKLKPLRVLNGNIMQFQKGDFSVNSNIDSQDEIGTISKNFNQAIENIKYLIESKHLFMRNIMHELKTPVTKALFLADMIETEDKRDKEELIETLYSMNGIIKELANIDKFQTHFSNLVLEHIDIQKLLASIKNELHIENLIIKEYEDLELIANKELIRIALKNLIDNGVKYSIDGRVCVNIYHNRIAIQSKGAKLKKELSYYTQAFTQEFKNQQGYGLGLYIVSQILKLHKFTLDYEYKDGTNSFTIYFVKLGA